MKLENEEKRKNNDNNELKSSRSNFKWLSKLKSQKNKNSSTKSKVIFNLDGMGEIEFAKMHREANRPLRKIKEFDKNTKFCPCCSLPIEQKGYIERFNFCDSIDKFSECGRGISLYFLYFRFAVIILFLVFTSVALPTFYLTYFGSKEIADICNKLYELQKDNMNITYPECIKFSKLDDKYAIYDIDWVLSFNSINLETYRILLYKLSNSSSNAKMVLYNYSIMYFISLMSLFILNLMHIILLYNMNKQYDILVTSPSDFTVMISNLHSAFHIFWKKINKINDIINGKIGNISSDRTAKTNDKMQNKINKLKEELGLENFPSKKEINILEAFHHFIKNKICENSKEYYFQINRINVCYKISEYMKIEEKIQAQKRQLVLAIFSPKQQKKNEDLDFNERKYYYPPFTIFGLNIFFCDICEKSKLISNIQEEKTKLESNLEELIKKSESLNEENFSGCTFITFETMNEAEKFLEAYPKNFIMHLLIKIKNLKYFLCKCFISKEKLKRFLLKRNLEAYIAPEPEDIIFENLEYTSLERNLRILLIYFFSFIIIAICFSIILLFNKLQIKNMENSKLNKNVVKYGLSFLITGVISLINVVFQIILEHLTKIEKHISMTNHYLSFSIKLTFFTFFNSAIVPYISNLRISKKNDYDLLVTNITTYFLTNFILTPLTWIFNFTFLYKKIKICYIEKKGSHDLTQRELNELYELPEMGIAYKYSYIFKTLLMSFFYMPIFPLSTFISSIGLFFGYFIEKFNFSKLYKRPEMINSKICEFYSNYFIINIFMLAIGDYIFTKDNIPNNKWPLFNIIFFGILLLIPYNQILAFDFLGINESDLKQEKYEDIFFTFYNDYERSNPMTKKEGIKRFVNKLREKNFIEENHYKNIIENLENINLMELYYESKKSLRQDSIKKSYTHKSSIILNKSSYLFNFNKFVKNNKEFVLNYLLSLGKKNPITSKKDIREENFNKGKKKDKDNFDNQNHIEIKTNDIKNSKPEEIIYNLDTKRNNLKDCESFSSIHINLKNNDENKNNSSSFNKINIYNYKSINQKKLLNKNKKIRFNLDKSKNEDIIIINDDKNNNKDKNKCENDKKEDYIDKNIDFKNDFQKDIEIYNKYKSNKKNKIKNDFKFMKYSKNIIIPNEKNNNNKNINSKEIIDLNQEQNYPLFNLENYDDLHQKILNQYIGSTNNLKSMDEFSEDTYRKIYKNIQKNAKIKNINSKKNAIKMYYDGI